MPSSGEQSILWIGSDAAEPLASLPLAQLMNEATFEQRLATAPAVLGEELLVIGRQLVDFEGDADRLDMLAVDAGGDLVLIELKVDEKFRFTDLQALAYAGPYAQQTTHTDQLAKTLLSAATAPASSPRHVPQPALSDQSTVDDAKALICEFLELDDFDRWTPSPKVRIKLVAPGFPDRILATVDWLESFHDLRIEAIAVSAYKIGGGIALNFNTVLPKPGPDEFAMPFKAFADKTAEDNTARKRNRSALPLLIENGLLDDGELLVLGQERVFPHTLRDKWDPHNTLFQVRVDVQSRKVRWRPTAEEEELLLSPAMVSAHICQRETNEEADYTTPVGGSFAKGTNGPVLEQLLRDHGLWQ